MSNCLVSIKNFSLEFKNKPLIQSCDIDVYSHSRIGIIGCNGSGKSTLLRKIAETAVDDYHYEAAYIPQILNAETIKSGGEYLIEKVLFSISQQPEILLLDEPSNHLDKNNKEKLVQALKRYKGALILVSHDKELLSRCCAQIWHIHHCAMRVFHSNYKSYQNELELQQQRQEQDIKILKKEFSTNHHQLMKEQKRAANSKKKGIKNIKSNKYPTVKSLAKADRGVITSHKNKQELSKKQIRVKNELNKIDVPEVLSPSFNFNFKNVSGPVLHIEQGTIGYPNNSPLITNLSLTINFGENIYLSGGNGCGKTSLIKAILGSSEIMRTGRWSTPRLNEIGYLDQHYRNLNPEFTVLESLDELIPEWGHQESRKHLNDFLFRKNEQVNTYVKQLSGGEKARLSLALIAAKAPKLLILDEMTNNLDMATKQHVIQSLSSYPGAIIFVCHEEDLLQDLRIDRIINLN